MLDLSLLNEVRVDPATRRARVGGGATMADLDTAPQEHGLAVTGGVISHTGVGGLTLGGGTGWLTHAFGLAIDNLVSAEVVLAADHARIADRARTLAPPLFELVTPIPYAGLQQMLDDGAPWGIRGDEKAIDLDDLSDEVIAILVDAAAGKSSPMSFMPIFRLDGAYSAVGDDDTAFGGARTPHYICNIAALAPDTEQPAADRAWVRTTWDALRPHAHGSGSYVNFMAEVDSDRVRASYGPERYARLARIKADYDPDNRFRRNANIIPADATAPTPTPTR